MTWFDEFFKFQIANFHEFLDQSELVFLVFHEEKNNIMQTKNL